VLEFPEDPNDVLGDIPVPSACCDVENENTPGSLPVVCRDDCLWAACKLAVVELAQQAEAQLMDGGPGTGNAAEDLQFWSDMLSQPTALQGCVDKARNGEPFDLGDGVNNPDVILAGDLSNGRLEIFCDSTTSSSPQTPRRARRTRTSLRSRTFPAPARS